MLSKPEFQGRTAYFAGIDKARFRRKVFPGDVLVLETEILKVKGPVGVGRAQAKVDGLPAKFPGKKIRSLLFQQIIFHLTYLALNPGGCLKRKPCHARGADPGGPGSGWGCGHAVQAGICIQ